MKKFLKNIVLFSILIIGILAAGECFVRHIPNPYSIKKEAIDSFGKDATTLVMGNSHTYFGILTDSIENAINVAGVSQNYEYDYRILFSFLSEMPRLKNALIDVSYSSFFDPPFEDYDWGTEIYYKIYLDIDKYSDLSYRNFEIAYFESYSGKLSKYILHKPLPATSPTGFGLDFKESHEVSPHQGKARAEAHSTMPSGYEPRNRLYFEKLIELCLERGIKPILVTTPAHRSYTDALNPKQLKRMKSLIRHYCDRYGLRHYDFLTDKRFDDSDFYDQDHLCRAGAEKFTSIVKEILSDSGD